VFATPQKRLGANLKSGECAMPITGQGWEIHIERQSTQKRVSDGKVRTVGTYQVFHDGSPVAGLSGMTAESKGPGDNSVAENGKRVETGRYPLWTQDGTKYDTIGYSTSLSTAAKPKPGIELKDTGARAEILIHPGANSFLSSIGCINLCTSLPKAAELISYTGSRKRVIALIDDMKLYLGTNFPATNGKAIPKVWAVIDGEP
jgi:hypothetical protein